MGVIFLRVKGEKGEDYCLGFNGRGKRKRKKKGDGRIFSAYGSYFSKG